MAAVLAGAGLLVSEEAALPAALVAEASALETLALRLLVMEARSELRLPAASPVAVASTLLMELALEAASPVSEATSELRSDRCEDTWDDTSLATLLAADSVVRPDARLSTAELALARAEVTLSPAEESSVGVGMMPSVVVVSWA